MSRSRAYCFTINNPMQEDMDDLDALPGVSYGICGEETGAEGTVHLQGYVRFENARAFHAVSTLLPRAHLEAANGTPAQNYAYCTKEGNVVWEEGTMPTDGGAQEKKRWADAWQHAMDGDFDLIDPQIKFTHYSTMKRIYKDHQAKPDDAEGVTGVWYYGKSGAGKSKAARVNFPNAYLKMCNKWWDGYQGEDSVIIDDFDLSHSVLAHHLKIWADRYSFMAEMKGEALQIRPLNIVVTSQYRPDQIWQDEETLEAIGRRFKLTQFKQLNAMDET